MPPKASSRKRAAQSEEYEADGGFVEDAPKSKKMKAASGKAPVDMEMKRDEDGNGYWELSGKRRLQVSNYKGNTFVGVREFYEKDGKVLPGKKGISFSIDQYAAFIELLPQIETELKKKSIEVPRPDYDGSSGRVVQTETGGDDDHNGQDEDEDKDKAAATTSEHRGKLDRFKHKRNHEATSDEDDD